MVTIIPYSHISDGGGPATLNSSARSTKDRGYLMEWFWFRFGFKVFGLKGLRGSRRLRT